MPTHSPSFQSHLKRGMRLALTVMLLTALLLGQSPSLPAAASTHTDIHGPAGSITFGEEVTVLPNGNFVVTDPGYDAPGGATDVGAVNLYSGATGTLISTLTGSTVNDRVGYGGVTVLKNGNFLVASPLWNKDSTATVYAGAVTWENAATGVNGEVSAVNSLTGSFGYDRIGENPIVLLYNGNYLVASPMWHDAFGAMTWGNGATGVRGEVSASNSLVGSMAWDRVGYEGATGLSNGNYVVQSPIWHNDVGAMDVGNGATGISGVVSTSNRLVGSRDGDMVGYHVTELSNANFVVSSPNWDNGAAVVDAGAVTWGNGNTGVSGIVSETISLVGSKAGNQVGSGGVTALTNGNFVVASPHWYNGAVDGAVTWGNGDTGMSGIVSETNSLVGSLIGYQLCGDGVTALTNGNYVVVSCLWHNGSEAVNTGAVTWGNGHTGVSGIVSETNSLVGSTAGDWVGSNGVTALTNGNFVVSSPFWHNDAANSAGAVTWVNGNTGMIGKVSTTNSLVGSMAGDQVGSDGVIALSDGNYVVVSCSWHNGAAVSAGAVTWGNGDLGLVGSGYNQQQPGRIHGW